MLPIRMPTAGTFQSLGQETDEKGIEMEVYHISRSLRLGDTLTPDYEKLYQLAEPFLQGLERGLDCFAAMVLQGKYLYAVMSRSGLRYWADYAKYATEAVFEFVRRREFPQSYSRLGCAYFFDSEACCRNHFEMDYGEDPKEGAKVGLFQVELEDPQYRDMSVYDLAYEAMSQRQDVEEGFRQARRYFQGGQTEAPMWEILSDKPARAVKKLEL